jgi:hypothetical protein
MRTFVAFLLMTGLLAVGAPPASAKLNGLPAGHWFGGGNNYGAIWKQGKGHGVTSADSYGRFTMNLYVSKGGHVYGTLNFGGGANSYVHGGHGHFTYWTDGFKATSSSAGSIAFNGIMNFRGIVTLATVGKDIPMEGVAPGNVVMHFTHLDCGSAKGDLAVDARSAQQKVGFQTNVKAPFVLLRVGNAEAPGGSGDDMTASGWFRALYELDADIEIDFKGRSKQYVEDEIKAGKDAMAEMQKYKECGGTLPLPADEIAAMKDLMSYDLLLADLRIKNMH